MFSPGTKPDIDLVEESKDLQEGYEKGPYLCEGCGFIHLIKKDGVIRVDVFDPTKEADEKPMDWDLLPTLEDFIELPMPDL